LKFDICFKYFVFSVCQIEKNWIADVCISHGTDEKCIQNFIWKIRMEEVSYKL
jgi:hypothetical protein